jgi:hypothetical protein
MANGTGTADEERGTTMPRPGNRFARLRRTAACAVLVALLATGYVPSDAAEDVDDIDDEQ